MRHSSPWLLLGIGCVLGALGFAASGHLMHGESGATGNTLSPAGESAAGVFERVSPSVVSITAIAVKQDYFSMNPTAIPRGAGSGFVWDKKGHIVTNLHVIVEADAIQVTLHDQTTISAELVGQAPSMDLAVLRVRGPVHTLKPIPIGHSGSLKVGQRVLAIGNPFGLDHSLTSGIVSALGRSIPSLLGTEITNVIQTDAAINPGNSGGPLLDARGRLVGINTSIRSPSGASAGIGFAVPADTISYVVPELIKYRRLRRPEVGIRVAPPGLAFRLGVRARGLLILSVVPGSPAARAGLRGTQRTRRGTLILGDIITAVEGKPTHNRDEFSALVAKYRPGDFLRLQVRSGSGLRSVRLQLATLK